MMKKKNLPLLTVLILGLLLNNAYSQQNSSEVKQYFCELYQDKTGNDINDNEVYSADQVQDAEDFVKGKVGDTNYLQLYMNDEIEDKKFIEEMIKLVIPAFIILGITLLCTIFWVLRWVFACCCCCCCKKNKSELIEKGEEIQISKYRYGLPMIINVIGFIMLIVCSIIGIFRGLKFFNGYYMMQCQISSFFDSFNTENSEQNWVGLIKLSQILDDVSDEFVNEVNNAFGGSADDFIQADYDSLVAENNGLDPTDGSTRYDASGENMSTIFYTQIYGPKTVDGSHLHQIDEVVVNGISVLKDSLLKVQASGENILGSDNGASFTQTLQDGSLAIKDFVATIDDQSVQFYDNTGDFDDSILDLAEYVIAGYFGVCILFGLISTASGLIVIYKKKYCFNIFLCCGAIFQLLFALVGAILLVVFYTFVQASLQTCDYSFQVITDYETFQELDLGEDINSKVYTCSKNYGGDGNIAADFNIEAEIASLREFTLSINESITTFDESKTTFDEADEIFQSAVDNLDLMMTTFTYKVGDSTESDIDDDLLDLSTNHETYCTGQQSYFVYDDDHCGTHTKDDLQKIAESGGMAVNDRCYNLNDYFTSHSYSFSRGGGNCFTDTGTNDLIKMMDVIGDKNEQSQGFKDQVVPLKGNVNDYYYVDSQNYIDGIDTMNQNIGTTLDEIEVLTGVDDGSAGNLSCLFVGQSISNVNSSLCVDTIPDMYWFSITLLCNSIAIVISYFGAACARFRFQDKEKQEKINKAIQENNGNKKQANYYDQNNPANPMKYDNNYTKY